MQSHAKRALKLAAFLVVIAVGFAAADVKLRVYLKDGSLQAGNLVSETKDAFVILTKEGRQEISKTNIMFVNGKTLAQWEARPDKNYSTEILPSEVPNPSFINNKAALPPPVALPVERKPITPPTAVSKPVEEAKPVEPEPVKELVKEGNARKITIKNEENETILEIPLTLGMVGALLAPVLAAVGAMAALLTKCTIVVEKK
jgi:hypothetical protein